MLRMKNEVIARTEESLEALEEAICRNHGDWPTACRELGVPVRHVHMWGLAEPEAAARIRQAQMIGWAGLESAAYQRAVIGVDKDVYYQGEVVGTQREYSDSLLAKMLVARVPGYGEQQHLHTHMVNVNVMPRATSYEEWRDQREKELSGDTVEGTYKVQELPLLERASPEVIQGRVRELNATGSFTKLRDVL